MRYGLVKENQFGFTKGGRTDYNHFILQYLAERTRSIKRKYYKNLIIVAIDFKKAFDSVDRGKLVEVLVKYKIHPEVIDMMVKVYSGDKTFLRLGGKVAEVEVTSGIRQGCTASTLFFKIVTFIILERLEELGVMFEVEGILISSLWFCDDTTMIANSIEAARKNIKIIKEVGREFGLEINEGKSSALVYGNGEGVKVNHIEGIQVVNKITYLGLVVGNINE